MSNSINVFCRIRPYAQSETNYLPCLKVIDEKSVEYTAKPPIRDQLNNNEPSIFTFDKVFDDYIDQQSIFETTAIPLLNKSLEGYNSTIMAYGQTNSGKTFTLLGDYNNKRLNQLKGIIPRAIDYLFHTISTQYTDDIFTMKVAYLEIYNEKVKDLMKIENDNIKIRENEDGMFMDGLTELSVSTREEVIGGLELSIENRSISFTNMNEYSSRSHYIFILNIERRQKDSIDIKKSRICFVDLAGSEKVDKTLVKGKSLDEAKSINKSLSELGNVVSALNEKANGKSAYINYRNSKLTRLLQNSLGGNTYTSLIVTISKAMYNDLETLSTLRFGKRAKNIKNVVEMNTKIDVNKLKELLNDRDKTIAELKAKVFRLERIKNGATLNYEYDAIPTNTAVQTEDLTIFDDLNIKIEEIDFLNRLSEEKDCQIQELIEQLDKNTEEIERLNYIIKDLNIRPKKQLLNSSIEHVLRFNLTSTKEIKEEYPKLKAQLDFYMKHYEIERRQHFTTKKMLSQIIAKHIEQYKYISFMIQNLERKFNVSKQRMINKMRNLRAQLFKHKIMEESVIVDNVHMMSMQAGNTPYKCSQLHYYTDRKMSSNCKNKIKSYIPRKTSSREQSNEHQTLIYEVEHENKFIGYYDNEEYGQGFDDYASIENDVIYHKHSNPSQDEARIFTSIKDTLDDIKDRVDYLAVNKHGDNIERMYDSRELDTGMAINSKKTVKGKFNVDMKSQILEFNPYYDKLEEIEDEKQTTETHHLLLIAILNKLKKQPENVLKFKRPIALDLHNIKIIIFQSQKPLSINTVNFNEINSELMAKLNVYKNLADEWILKYTELKSKSPEFSKKSKDKPRNIKTVYTKFYNNKKIYKDVSLQASVFGVEKGTNINMTYPNISDTKRLDQSTKIDISIEDKNKIKQLRLDLENVRRINERMLYKHELHIHELQELLKRCKSSIAQLLVVIDKQKSDFDDTICFFKTVINKYLPFDGLKLFEEYFKLDNMTITMNTLDILGITQNLLNEVSKILFFDNDSDKIDEPVPVSANKNAPNIIRLANTPRIDIKSKKLIFD